MPRLLFCFLLLASFSGLAQQDQQLSPAALISEKASCGTPDPTPEQIRYTLEVIDKAARQDRNAGTTLIPIMMHIVTLDDGTGGISLAVLNEGLSNLNYFYQPAGIEFFICDTNIIQSTNWYDFNSSQESALASGNEVTDAVNVFFVNTITIGSGSYCGYARFPSNNLSSNRILMKNSCTTNAPNGTFVHEFGHYFSLYHTHQSTEFGNNHVNAENVRRSTSQANCATKGDLLCDTEADPSGSTSNCMYSSGGADRFGISYTPPVDNVMSYYSDACGGRFTPQQYTRMSGALTTRLGHTAYDLDGCVATNVTDPSGLIATANGSYGIDLSWIDNATNELGYLVEASTDGGTTFSAISGAGLAPNLTNYTAESLQSYTQYAFRVKASNDDGNHYSNISSVINTGLVYCAPDHVDTSCTYNNIGVGIEDFELTGGTPAISNLSNGCNGPLSVFSNTVPASEVIAGNTYNYTVRLINNAGTYYPSYLTIWLDANQDGDFNDVGEVLYQATSKASRIMTGTITIPTTASNDTTTLRVRVSTSGPITDPCNYLFLSEAEDYYLKVTGSSYESSLWIGNTIDWSSPANWSTGLVPNATTHVLIPTAPSGGNFPTIPTSYTAYCNSLHVAPGASLTLDGNLDASN